MSSISQIPDAYWQNEKELPKWQEAVDAGRVPLHKAYFGFARDVQRGLVYGAQLNYEGTYNELDRGPYATLDAHLAYRTPEYEFGLYGTNLTNADAFPFTIYNGGILYPAETGQPMIPTPAYNLQGAKVVFVVTRTI